MTQLTFDGMPEPLYPATPARLGTYADCPRRYRMAYLDRPAPPKGPPWGHNSVGAAVHNALARWWDLPRSRRTPEAGGALLVSGWLTDGFRDGRQAVAARERARAQVERYLADVDPDDEPVAVDQRREGVVVVDYQTGRSVLTVDTARESLALAVYAAGAAHTLHRPCFRVELHHLPTGDVLAWDHTDETLAEHLRRADSLAAEMARLDAALEAGLTSAEADEAFPARVAARCGWCDFRAVCGPGRAVPPRQPWAGVVDDD